MWRAIGLIGCLALVACTAPDSAADRQLEQAWAADVLLGSEVGDTRNAVVRWSRPVSYLVVAAPERVRHAIDRAFSQLRDALSNVHPLSLEHVAERDPRIGTDGYVTVFAKAPRDAAHLAALHGGQAPQPDADGWFTIVWNRSFELLRAVVFVDPELSDRWLAHTALEEMFQALGPSNDSPLLRDSLLFESPTAAGSHQSLARVDVQVLLLLYRDLQPGCQAKQIRRAMQSTWDYGAKRLRGRT